MFVSEVIEEARTVLGKCDNAYLFRRLTDAVKLANNQADFEVNLGQMDICVCDGCATLPADVGTVLAVNSGGYPTLIRDQWYQYHINGRGSSDCTPCGYTDELGRVCTFRDPSSPVLLVAQVENALDSNVEVRVFGWDDSGKRIYTEGEGGILEDGFLVPTAYGFPVPSSVAPAIARIDRIQKPVTNGFIKLIAIDPTTLASHTLIGYYEPWETVPNYRRIKVNDRSWIRLKYLKAVNDVRGLSDWIAIDNREALLLLLKAVKFRLENQIGQAKEYEIEGMRLLSNEAERLRPPGPQTPQIISNEYPESFGGESLFN